MRTLEAKKMQAELIFEMCGDQDCDCDLPHLPEEVAERLDYMHALAQIAEWRIGYAAGYTMKFPD